MKLILMRGVPGSGKSTWSKEYVEKNPNTLIVSRDSYRFMFGGKYWYPQRENLISKLEQHAVVEALREGWDVLVDNTCTRVKYIKNWMDILDKNEIQAEVCIKEMRTEGYLCISRDQDREKTVGSEVITDMLMKIQWYREDLDKLNLTILS